MSLVFVIFLIAVLSFINKTQAVQPSDFGLKEGDVISATGDPDVYIVNAYGYKRLFVNPKIFNLYGHLGWNNIKNVSPTTRDAFITSGLFRNCESNDQKVYGLDVVSEDVANLRWVNTSGAQAVADDTNFFKKVFCINNREGELYNAGPEYASVRQISDYTRKGVVAKLPTPIPVSTGLRIDLVAPNKILSGVPYTIVIKGAGFHKNAKIDFGSGNIQPGYAVISGNEISVLVPSGMPALTFNLTITNPDGQITVLKDALTVQVAPLPISNALTTSEIFDKVSPSIVQVGCKIGSGFVFENSGYILTNEHVVRGYNTCEIKLKDNTILSGVVLGSDSINDVAVIKVDKNLPFVTLGDSSESALKLGSKIYILGHPLAFKNTNITQGSLTSRQTTANLEELISDAATEGGSSGGAWVNEKGDIVGLHTGIYGCCFRSAVPINLVKTLTSSLKAGTSTPSIPSTTPTPTPSITPTPTPTPIPIVPGAITASLSPSAPTSRALYWGQTGADFSIFKFSSTNEGFYIEKINVKASDTNNIKMIQMVYKNKSGIVMTKTSTLNSSGVVAFGFIGEDRPYIPKNSNLDISIKADLKTKAEGATQGIKFSIDLVGGGDANTFKAVGEGSGTVITGSAISNIVGNNQVVYRVFPEFSLIAPSSTRLTTVDPVLRFTITGKGLPDSILLFNEIKFAAIASGTGAGDANITVRDVADNSIVDTDIVSNAITPGSGAQLMLNFSNKATEITGGVSKTFAVYLDSIANFNTPINITTGVGSDYFQLSLKDNVDGLISWNSDNSTATSLSGFIKNLPLTGYQFSAQ